MHTRSYPVFLRKVRKHDQKQEESPEIPEEGGSKLPGRWIHLPSIRQVLRFRQRGSTPRPLEDSRYIVARA